MKHTLFILALITATIQTFAQSPRIKLNQITKDSLTGSVLISSPTDSGMVYSRDLFISYGADTVLILGGDTLAATSGIISSVLSDGVTITGDGTTGSELTVDTNTVIATKQDLDLYYLDSNPDGYTSNTGTVTSVGGTGTVNGISLSGSVTSSGNLTLGGTLSGVDLTSQVTGTLPVANGGTGSDTLNFVDLTSAQTVGGAKTFTSALTQSGGDVNFDSNTFFVDVSENRVGIGTSSPSALLHVEPDPGASANFMKYDGTRLALEYGDRNIAVGNNAGNSSSGSLNLSFGTGAGQNLQSTAEKNSFIGVISGSNANVSGAYNLGLGYAALYDLTSGNNNIAFNDGLFITSGSNNIILGLNAGRTSGGGNGITTGNDNIYMGIDATASGTTVSNEIAIGKGAIGQGSNSIMLGNSSITSLFCYDTSISSPSDLRDKKNVQNLNAGLDFVNMLRPVVFEWNMREGTKQGISDIGFIAQELEMAQMQSNQKDYINLTMYSESNDRWFAQYANLIPIYAKAIQDLDKKLQEKEFEIEQLKSQIQIILTEIEQIKNN